MRWIASIVDNASNEIVDRSWMNDINEIARVIAAATVIVNESETTIVIESEIETVIDIEMTEIIDDAMMISMIKIATDREEEVVRIAQVEQMHQHRCAEMLMASHCQTRDRHRAVDHRRRGSSLLDAMLGTEMPRDRPRLAAPRA